MLFRLRIADCTIFAACESTRFSTDFHKRLLLRFHLQVADNGGGDVTCAIERAENCVAVVYSRADLLRILHLTPRQLANWERAGLIVASTAYSFSDLLKIKKVRDLCAMRCALP